MQYYMWNRGIKQAIVLTSPFEKPNNQPNLIKWIKPCPIHLARVLLNTEMELEQIKSFHITEYRRFTAECSGYHVVHYLIFYGRVTQNR